MTINEIWDEAKSVKSHRQSNDSFSKECFSAMVEGVEGGIVPHSFEGLFFQFGRYSYLLQLASYVDHAKCHHAERHEAL